MFFCKVLKFDFWGTFPPAFEYTEITSKVQDETIEVTFANSKDQWKSSKCTFDIGLLQVLFSNCFIDIGTSALLFNRLTGALCGYACHVQGSSYFVSYDDFTTSTIFEAVKTPSIALVLNDYRKGGNKSVKFLEDKKDIIILHGDSHDTACYVNGNYWYFCERIT